MSTRTPENKIMHGISTQFDIEEIEKNGLPVDLPTSVYDMISHGVKLNPRAPALSFFLTTEQSNNPETWTYQELIRSINQTANCFRALGISRQETLACVLPNLPETHFTIWGAETAGTLACFNPMLEGEALRDLIASTNARVLVTLAPMHGVDLWDKIHPYLKQLPTVKHVIWVHLTDHVRGVKYPIARLLHMRRRHELHGSGNPVPESMTLHHFSNTIAKYESEYLNFHDLPKPSDVSSKFCTGGTTGLPKIAQRTHSNEVFNAWSAGQFLGDSVGSGKTVLCGLPLFHVNAVLVTGLLPFSKGAHVLLAGAQGYRTPGLIASFWKIVGRFKVNFFSGVPTLYATLLDIPSEKRHLKSLEYGLCGAAPLPVEVMKRFEEKTGIRILEGYGLTEATCVSSVNPPLGNRVPGSIGLRIPFQEMKTVILNDNGDYLRDCGDDEVGNIIVRGPNVFSGYSNPKENHAIWLIHSGVQPWLITGDLGRRDSKGYFFVTGRKKDLIIRGGHNIDPKVIEDAIYTHPDVQHAAAIGRPDKHAGELPVVYVQLKANSTVGDAELLSHCTRSIKERAAVPKSIRILNLMPLTGVGKIYKPELRRLELIDSVQTQLEKSGISKFEINASLDETKGLTAFITSYNPNQTEQIKACLGVMPIQFELL